MKKSTLFISGVLSAFMLAVLAGAVTAYRSLASSSQQTNTQQNAPVVQRVANPAAASISPEDAAKVAARYLNRSDLYSVESSSLNGASAYMVTFSSGDVVYVSPEGQVVSHVPAPAAVSSVRSSNPSVQQPAPSFGGESEHEDGDDDD